MKFLIGLIFPLILTACGDTGKAADSSSITPPPAATNPVPDSENTTPNTNVPPVTDLSIISTSENEIVLRWADKNDAAGYIIRRDGNQIATIAKGLYTFTDNDLLANESYIYEVIAFNESGRESMAEAITAQAIINTPPAITKLEQIVLEDTLAIGSDIVRINASDIDNHPLSYKINSDLFEIDQSGNIRLKASLVSVSGRVVVLAVEVSDGYSLSSSQFKIGVTPLTANGSNQGLSRQVYKDASIDGNLDSLKTFVNFPDTPTETSIEAAFVAPSNIAHHYGQVMQGYIVPPISGEYTFWIAADDQAELYLSNNEKEQDLVKISQLSSYTNPKQWDRHASQQSSVQKLVAGRAYYIKAIMTEGSGGDHLAVAWQGPGIEQAVIANEFLRIPLDLQNPSVVTNMTWLKMDHDKILLEWSAATDNRGVSHYDIYENGQKIATTENNSIELTELESSKLYGLMIKSVDITGNESAFSSLLPVQMDDYTPPSSVSEITLNSVGPNHVHFSWPASTDENNSAVLYRIFQNNQLIHQGYQTELQINKLEPNTAFSFNIEAIDTAGNRSIKSSPLNVSTHKHITGTPTFTYPSFEYAVAADAPANSIFATLLFQADSTPVFDIFEGNSDGYFAINELGELSLTKELSINSSQVFDLKIRISLAEKSSMTEVRVYAIEATRFTQTGILQQVWSGIGGGSIDNINTNRPVSNQQILTDVKTPSNMGNNYGQRLSGYLQVPTSGNYTFWVASDDDSEVRISTDMSTTKLEPLARVTGYTNPDGWYDNKIIKRNIRLNAGQYYYFEVMHKQGGGGNHLSVAWQGPGISKQLLSANYIIPSSSFIPTEIEVQTAYQSSFETLGNEITIDYLVAASAAGFPVVVYYGDVDAGESAEGWQYQVDLGTLLAGNQTITLPNIKPGGSYFIRFENTGPAGSSWSGEAIKVDTVVIDESKTVGEALPQTLSLNVNINDKELFIELEKHSMRSPNYQLLTFDERRFQQYQAVSPMPEVRTYRGYVRNDAFRTVTGVVDANGKLYVSAWGGDRHHWNKDIDISAQINPDALGNSESSTTELKINFSAPESIDNRLYLPKPGRDFHNNLARVSFLFEHNQFKHKAGSNIINAIAQMENHLNELDYVWAQKTGLRWDVGRALIEIKGSANKATQPRPAAKDGTNFSMDFQDPINGGHCWGGGDWLGCVASYRMQWGFTHEVGHNFGLGHGEQTDSNYQIQQPSTQMSNMQAWKTTHRLQKGSKFKPAEAITNPMLPATFKDYLTVYQNENGTVNPLANDYDANGDELIIESFETTTLEGGQVIESPSGSGNLVYTPKKDFIGVDQFSYVAADTQGYKTKGPVQIQVLGSVSTANGLAAHWDMDTLDANVIKDLSGQGHDLTAPDLSRITPLAAAEASIADVQVMGPNNQSNQALSIPLVASNKKANDAIGHLLLPHNLDPGHKSFTAAMWFKYSNISGNKLLIGKSSSGPNNMQYGGWEIRSEANNDSNWLKMQVNYRDRLMKDNKVVLTQKNALSDGAWHHVAMVIDRENNELRGYLDGTALKNTATLPVGNGPIMAAMNNPNYGGGSPFRVGGHTSLTCVDGVNEGDAATCNVTLGQAFDSVKLFNKSLTEAEVVALFNE